MLSSYQYNPYSSGSDILPFQSNLKMGGTDDVMTKRFQNSFNQMANWMSSNSVMSPEAMTYFKSEMDMMNNWMNQNCSSIPSRDMSMLARNLHQMNHWMANQDTSQVLGSLKNILKCDIIESADNFKFHVDMPGINKSDISVCIENGNLIVRAERRRTHDMEGWRVHRMETDYGKVERAMAIPLNADFKKICASYDNGVLEITMPKIGEGVDSGSTIKVDVK